MPTIIVAAVIALLFLAVVIKGIDNKKKGKGSCGCDCANCGKKKDCGH